MYLPNVHHGQGRKHVRTASDPGLQNAGHDHSVESPKRLMTVLLLSACSTLAACTPSPQKVAMPDSKNIPENASRAPAPPKPVSDGAGNPNAKLANIEKRDEAAVGPMQEAESAAANPVPAQQSVAVTPPISDTPMEAAGRRTLSTAFVHIGPGGHLWVRLRDGSVVILSDVKMGPKDYCGTRVASEAGSKKFCGGYADVIAARPGDG